MSNVIEFSQIPMWNPNLTLVGSTDTFVLNKTNIKEFWSYVQSKFTPSETKNDGYGIVEMMEDLQNEIDLKGFVTMKWEILNDE